VEPFDPENPEKGARVWLTQSELATFTECAPHDKAKIAISLCSCGLRVSEAVKITNKDRFKDDRGWMLGVIGKGNKYREVPIPDSLSMVDLELGISDRTVRRWVNETAEKYYWLYLAHSNSQPSYKSHDIYHISPHDLRRTWGTLLLQAGVEPVIVMAWGGWESWEVFRQHYLDVANPEWQAKEREKVAWL
tara:strand:- start:205 stop:777 length:573 start_codon:yes stop_codon:yes gene_type:complete